MATEVLKSFGTLQSELEQAKSSLKGVDENIKRLIGRDPSEVTNRPAVKRQISTNEEVRGRTRTVYANINSPNFNRSRLNFENEETPAKRRSVDSSVFRRLSERPVRHFDNEFIEPSHKQQLISRVIVTPREIPSRQEVLAAQGADEKSKARNRRMFGALLGTLQKFRQEETKLKPKEEKRAQVEKKLEEQEIREKEEMKKERQDLFLNRKKKQAEIRMIELKMTRMKDHAAWEERQKPRSNFIITKSKPEIYYLPKILNDPTKELLETCKQDVEKIIDKKRQEVYEELEQIEARMRNKFDPIMITSQDLDEKEDTISDGEINETMPATDQNNENIEVKQDTQVTQEIENVNIPNEQSNLNEQEKCSEKVDNDGNDATVKAEEIKEETVSEQQKMDEGNCAENAQNEIVLKEEVKQETDVMQSW